MKDIKIAKSSWPKLVLGNLAVLVALLLVAGVFGEVYYRYIFDSTDSFGLTRVCKRWYERHWQLNREGYRDNVEYKAKIAPGKRRVTFLGDSFTTGHGIADVDKRFANILRRWGGPGREVHVIALNGADTGAELQTLIDLTHSRYELDTVVLVYVLNDISDIVPAWQAILKRIYENEPKEEAFWRKSYFLDMIYWRIVSATDPHISDYYGFVRAAYNGPIWEEQKARLRRLVEVARANNVKLLVVTFPFLQALGRDYEYRDVHRKLDAFWREQGVPNLDLLSVFEAYKPKDLVIGKFDAHPNEFAHEKAALAIGGFLDENMR